MDPQNNPDSYGTGKAPVKRSRAPFILALLGLLLGTNFITAGFFFDFGQSTAPGTQVSPTVASKQPAEPPQVPVAGLADVIALGDDQRLKGTGIILSSDGYVLTNCAVVEDAERLTVTLDDGRSFIASLVGMDADSDIAVLKIPVRGLIPADYVPSDNVAAGDPLSIFPFATPNDLTGILVEDGRLLIGGMERRVFPVDCGAGSLLVNEEGKLVAFGMEQGGALPISEAISLAGELIFYGELNAPTSFGMEVTQLDEAQRIYWELPGGVAVTRVAEGGNAQQAGLQTGDVLLSINGAELWDTEGYWNAVKSCQGSSLVQMEVYRAGELLRVELFLQPE